MSWIMACICWNCWFDCQGTFHFRASLLPGAHQRITPPSSDHSPPPPITLRRRPITLRHRPTTSRRRTPLLVRAHQPPRPRPTLTLPRTIPEPSTLLSVHIRAPAHLPIITTTRASAQHVTVPPPRIPIRSEAACIQRGSGCLM